MKSAAALLKANEAQAARRINPPLINNLQQESQDCGTDYTPLAVLLPQMPERQIPQLQLG